MNNDTKIALEKVREELDVIVSALLRGQGGAGRLQTVISYIDSVLLKEKCSHRFGNMAKWPRKCFGCGKDESQIACEGAAEVFADAYKRFNPDTLIQQYTAPVGADAACGGSIVSDSNPATN